MFSVMMEEDQRCVGPYAGFEGRIGRTFATSEPWWPERAASPERAGAAPLMHYHGRARLPGGWRGVLVAHGDQGGGYVLYVEDGELTYVHNEYGCERFVRAGPVPDGARELVVELVAPGGWVWDLRLLVDDEERASPTAAVSMLWLTSPALMRPMHPRRGSRTSLPRPWSTN